MEAIILAGGKGTRLKQIVSDRPKPLADVNGVPFLNFLLQHLENQGCEHFIISTGFKRHMVRCSLGNHFNSIPITYVEERTPLGTGGAFVKSCEAVKTDGKILLLNGDTYFAIDYRSIMEDLDYHQAQGAMALFAANQDNRFGKVELDGVRVSLDVKNSKASIGELAYAGVSAFSSRSIIDYSSLSLDKYSLEEDLLINMISNGAKIVGRTFDQHFTDIGIPKDYLDFCARNHKTTA